MALLQEVDDLVRRDHHYLSGSDKCYFHGEYTARKGYSFSETNNLIYNLKKPTSKRGRGEWQYKLNAIKQAANIFSQGLLATAVQQAMFVPVPPSKAPGDPEYDDRMSQVIRAMAPNIDIRELVTMKASVKASHERIDRPSPDDLYAGMTVNQALVKPPKKLIIVVDDVLTTGSHFRAVKRHLAEVYPAATIVGLFVARRVPETIEWDQIGNL